MQINQLSPCDTVESMIRALRTGSGVVIGWLPEELTEEEHFRLTEAAEEGECDQVYHAPGSSDSYRRGQLSGLNSLKFVSLSEIKIFLEFLTAGCGFSSRPQNCGKACLVRFSLILLHKIRSKMLNNRYTELFSYA